MNQENSAGLQPSANPKAFEQTESQHPNQAGGNSIVSLSPVQFSPRQLTVSGASECVIVPAYRRALTLQARHQRYWQASSRSFAYLACGCCKRVLRQAVKSVCISKTVAL
ncbi:hypothetical protein V8J88_07695 [Massilia sp. W12]|uniref:hypothetical protein n=1 Tax=Massilia sp. W12 TaxID=3126507 RepID=UPI0030CDB4BC